jgi:hypothetical protein
LVTALLSCFGLSCRQKVTIEEEMGFGSQEISDDSLYYFETEIRKEGEYQVDEVTYYLKEGVSIADFETEDGNKYDLIDYEAGELSRITIKEPVDEVWAQGTKKPDGILWIFVDGLSVFKVGSSTDWIDNYDLISRYSQVYDFSTGTLEPVDRSLAKQLSSNLKSRCSFMRSSDGMSDYETYKLIMKVFPTINYDWKYSCANGNFKIVRNRINQLRLNKKVLYPNMSEFPIPVGWMSGGQLVYASQGNVSGGYDYINVGAIVDGVVKENIRCGELSGWPAIDSQRELLAVPFSESILVGTRYGLNNEIQMYHKLNGWPRTWESARSMIAFNPSSDLICYTWSEETYTDRSSDREEFWVANYETGQRTKLEGIYRKIGNDCPFFWLD